MLDAMLDYAVNGGEVPAAFTENPEGPIPPLSNDILPQRMDGNQLHRYSKVLEQSGQNAAQPQVSVYNFGGYCLHLNNLRIFVSYKRLAH